MKRNFYKNINGILLYFFFLADFIVKILKED